MIKTIEVETNDDFEKCEDCIHSSDSGVLCKMRGCIHAIMSYDIKECYIPKESEKIMQYLTTAQIAKKWNISQRRVSLYCKDGRIPDAEFKGKMWLIPENAVKPEDPRKECKE